MNRRRDSIPTELTSRPRWVLWKYGRPDKNGKPAKLPFKINGRCADVTDARDWSSFELAAAAYDRTKGFYAGVGFVMNGDGLCGVDFDHCIENGKIVIPKIATYVAALDTYTEISPSGTGLRLFAFGKLPPEGRKLSGLEFYDGVPHESGKPRGGS
jgi:putative DNA primase/helicase